MRLGIAVTYQVFITLTMKVLFLFHNSKMKGVREIALVCSITNYIGDSANRHG